MPILLIISILSPILPLVVGIKKRFTLLWLYVATGFAFDVAVVTQKRLFHVNQHPASNVFVLVEFVLVSLVFRKHIIKDRSFFYIFIAAMCVFFVANTLNKTIYDFNAFGASFFSLSYILFAIAGFYIILKHQRVVFLDRYSFFWVNVAFLVYASGNLLLFLFKDYLRQVNSELFATIWHTFFLVLNISKNIFLTFALSPKTSDVEPD